MKLSRSRPSQRKPNILIDMSIIAKESWFHDFTINLEVESFRYVANRLLFAASSEYFQSKLRNPDVKEIQMTNGKYYRLNDIFLNIINNFFLYNELDLNENNIYDVLEFSTIIYHPEMQMCCIFYMQTNINDDNFFIYWNVGIELGLTNLINISKNYALENFKTINDKNLHLSLSFEQLAQLIPSMRLNIETEEKVFISIKKWIELNEVERIPHVPKLIKLIDFSRITLKFVIRIITPLCNRYEKDYPEQEKIRCSVLWNSCNDKSSSHCNRVNVECIDYVAFNFQKLIETEEFLVISPENFKRLLKFDSLDISGEEKIIEALYKWITFDQRNRIIYLSQLLKRIRWQYLSMEFVFQTLERFLDFKSCDSFNIIFDALKWHMIPEIRSDLKYLETNQRFPNDTLMIVGGSQNDEGNVIEIYNPRTRGWKIYCDLNLADWEYLTVLLGENLIIIGGPEKNEVHSFNLKTKKMKSLPFMIEKRCDFSATLINGSIYVCGGRDYKSDFLDSVEVWNPSWKCWKVLSPMLNKRADHTAVAYKNKLYIFSGHNGINVLSMVEEYDLDQNKWSEIVLMQEGIYGISTVVVNDLICVIIKYNAYKTLIGFQMFNPETKEWFPSLSMLNKFDGLCAVYFRDKIVVIGGEDTNKIFEFNLQKNICTEVLSSRYSRYFFDLHIVPCNLLFSE